MPKEGIVTYMLLLGWLRHAKLGAIHRAFVSCDEWAFAPRALFLQSATKPVRLSLTNLTSRIPHQGTETLTKLLKLNPKSKTKVSAS
jgi:hypothetical protein